MKIVLAMVTAGEESLAHAIQSFRPHVDAVVGILTDPSRADEVFPLFDRCEVSTSFNWPLEESDDEYRLRDFGAARNASFDLAREEGADWVLWADSDDELVSGENLRPALEALGSPERARCLARYEYAVDPKSGALLREQWRERVVPARAPYYWKRPVHEHLVAEDGRSDNVRLQGVAWRHKSDPFRPKSDRNLGILRWHAEQLGPEAVGDAWLHLNLGTELQLAGEYGEALDHFAAYVLLSGRADERALACVSAAECALAPDPSDRDAQEKALAWCASARRERECFETVFAEARVRLLRGMMGGDDKQVLAAANLLSRAIELGPTETPLATRPDDLLWEAPNLLREAYEALGAPAHALAAAALCLRARPDDRVMRLRFERYEEQAELKPRFESSPGKREVVFVCCATPEAWDPAIVAKEGRGGSETAVVEMSRRLAARGHRVRVIAPCEREGVFDGVWWQPLPFVGSVGTPDVAVCWRDAALLEASLGARRRLLWVHDTGVSRATPQRLSLAERVLGLSEWHCADLRKKYDLPEGRVARTRNGIDLDRFASPSIFRDPHRAIYSSSPDRGLPVLLDVWHKVRERVRDATLDVFYGFEGLDAEVRNGGGGERHRYFVEQMKTRLALYEPLGVVFRGRIGQRRLAREMLSAGVWAFPTHFPETSCIGAMEAQAAGMWVVTSDLAALSETARDATLIQGDWLSPEYQKNFVDAVVYAMTSVGRKEREDIAQVARQRFSWDGVVEQWENLFEEVLAEPDHPWVRLSNLGRRAA